MHRFATQAGVAIWLAYAKRDEEGSGIRRGPRRPGGGV